MWVEKGNEGRKEIAMNNDQLLWKLAKARQDEILREVEHNRQLQELGYLKPLRVPKKLLIVLVCLVPLALLLARAVVA
jgi:hypothetical protein